MIEKMIFDYKLNYFVLNLSDIALLFRKSNDLNVFVARIINKRTRVGVVMLLG